MQFDFFWQKISYGEKYYFVLQKLSHLSHGGINHSPNSRHINYTYFHPVKNEDEDVYDKRSVQ